ncbi:hypothetical protein [Lacinutrix cladophorae]
MAKLSTIGKAASKKANEIFADKISSLTILTSEEIQTLFPEKADRDELEELLEIINADIEDKIKKQKLVENINKISGAILKIGKKFIGFV